MTCPRCTVARIGRSGACELCGFVPPPSPAPAPEAAQDPARRELAGEFRLEQVIGQGRTTTVYLARDRSNVAVVLKVQPRSPDHPDADERFKNVMTRLRRLEHPHLMRVTSYGVSSGLLWYAMPWTRSRSLRERLSGGAIELRTCQRIVSQVASALESAHRQGVDHGALKPENVLIDDEGWVRVVDTAVATARGEQPVSDQYALGALAYECLSGKPPGNPPVPIVRLCPGLTEQAAAAIDRAVSPEAGRRFPSVLHFVSALERGMPRSTGRWGSSRKKVPPLLITDWKPPVSPRGLWAFLKKLLS